MDIACLLVLIAVGHVTSQTAPNYCTFISGTRFECDYASMVSSSDRPIPFSGFSPQPQEISIDVNGFIPFFGDSQVFSADFAGINVNTFDTNYPTSLTIDCGFGGSMYMSAGAFANMSHVQRLTIKNCDTYYIPAYAFQEMTSLDYFGFIKGTIDDVDPNAMAGLNVEKLTTDAHSMPRNIGKFEVMYSPFSNKYVPPGLLFSWKNLTSASLVGADLETITADVFSYNTKLNYIDLSDNTFTSMPSGIFSGLEGLSDVRLFNIDWQCSCTNNWFVEYGIINNITMFGDFMCSAGMTASKYYYENCVTVDLCDGTIGITMMKKCLTLWAMLSYSLGLVAFITMIVCLALIIHTKRQAGQKQTRRVKAKGRWNKVMDKTVKKKISASTKKK